MSQYNINGGCSPSKNNVSRLQEIVNLITHKTNFAPKVYGTGYLLRCPAHEDKNPSLGVSEGDDGRILMFCHAGCTVESVCKSVGISVKDLRPQQNKPNNSVYKKQGSHCNASSARRSAWSS